MVRIELNNLDAPSQVRAHESFSVSVQVDNLENVAPLLREPSCNSNNLAPAGERVQVELRIRKNGQTVLTREEEVCAKYGPMVGDATATFTDLELDLQGAHSVIVEAEAAPEGLTANDRLEDHQLHVSGTSNNNDDENGSSDGAPLSDEALLAGGAVVALLFILSFFGGGSSTSE